MRLENVQDFFFAQGSSYCFQEGILYTVIKAVQPMLWIII